MVETTIFLLGSPFFHVFRWFSVIGSIQLASCWELINYYCKHGSKQCDNKNNNEDDEEIEYDDEDEDDEDEDDEDDDDEDADHCPYISHVFTRTSSKTGRMSHYENAIITRLMKQGSALECVLFVKCSSWNWTEWVSEDFHSLKCSTALAMAGNLDFSFKFETLSLRGWCVFLIRCIRVCVCVCGFGIACPLSNGRYLRCIFWAVNIWICMLRQSLCIHDDDDDDEERRRWW